MNLHKKEKDVARLVKATQNQKPRKPLAFLWLFLISALYWVFKAKYQYKRRLWWPVKLSYFHYIGRAICHIRGRHRPKPMLLSERFKGVRCKTCKVFFLNQALYEKLIKKK